MLYYIYQVTNQVNQKIYVGVHKTKNLNDGYMGSGKIIRRAIEKYGIENFKKDILQFFKTPEEMFKREKEIVTEEFLARKDVYNLRRGGTGGFDFINANKLNINLTKNEARLGGLKVAKNKSAQWRLDRARTARANRKEVTREEMEKVRQHAQTPEAQQKRKITFKKIGHQQGKKNSNYGNCWIFSSEKKISILVPKSEVQHYLNEGWSRGRRLIF